jgi:hypothetical protein
MVINRAHSFPRVADFRAAELGLTRGIYTFPQNFTENDLTKPSSNRQRQQFAVMHDAKRCFNDANTVRSGQITLGPDARLPTTCHLSAAGSGTRIIYN